MTETYYIPRWHELHESAASRKLKRLSWVAIPNENDSRAWRRIVSHPRCCELLSAWMGLLQVASRMPQRGVLADGDGPLDALDLSAMTGLPQEAFGLAFEVLTDPKIGWLAADSSKHPLFAQSSTVTAGGSPPSVIRRSTPAPNRATTERLRAPLAESATKQPKSGGSLADSATKQPKSGGSSAESATKQPKSGGSSADSATTLAESATKTQNLADRWQNPPQNAEILAPPGPVRSGITRQGITRSGITERRITRKGKAAEGMTGNGTTGEGPTRSDTQLPEAVNPTQGLPPPCPGAGAPAPDFTTNITGPDRDNGSADRFRQRFVVGIAQALKLTADQTMDQRRALLAVARRIVDDPRRERLMAAMARIAADKKRAGLDFPVRAWQAEVDRRWPPERSPPRAAGPNRA